VARALGSVDHQIEIIDERPGGILGGGEVIQTSVS